MNSWTTPEMIAVRMQREWDRGRILTALLADDMLFPFRIPLKGPTSSEWLHRFAPARDWIAALQRGSKEHRGSGYGLEWREFTHKDLGRNRVPTAAVFESAVDALAFLGREAEAQHVQNIAGMTAASFPELHDWAVMHPLAMLEAAPDWPRLLAVLRWAVAHPRSGLYVRQVDVPGVDTKFIEQRRRLLGDLLDIVLPPDAIQHKYTGIAGFERRYGFRSKPSMVRFRFLDPMQNIEGLTDLSVPSGEFARLKLAIGRVFIVENEIEFLAFPSVPNSIAVFGAGYGFGRFDGAQWLTQHPVYYWGDIDTHGLAILDELRQYIPDAQSILMDRETLRQYRDFWGIEERPSTHQLTRLTPDELALYEDLQTNRLGYHVRLEQEQIPLSHVERWLREKNFVW